MQYRIEHSLPNGKEDILQLGAISTAAAQARARRLSAKEGELGPGIPGHSVYLYGFDEDGTDQEYYSYFGGGLAEKDLVKDWDK